jgi:hypothetical protein
MPTTVQMLQTRQGDAGATLTAGQQYSIRTELADVLIAAGSAAFVGFDPDSGAQPARWSNPAGRALLDVYETEISHRYVVGLTPNDNGAAARAANAAILQAAFAIPGRWSLPRGKFYTAPFTITAQVAIVGTGANNGYGPVGSISANGSIANTTLATTSATAVLITVTATGCVFRDFDIANESVSNPTAGAGIQWGTTISFPADGWRMNNVSVRGFYINVDNVSGCAWAMTDCLVYDPVQYGVRTNNVVSGDEGDSVIHGCQIISGLRNVSGGVPAAVYVGSGGGLKFTSNKINSEPPANQGNSQFKKGLMIELSSASGVFVITGNSIEGLGGTGVIAALYVDNATNGGELRWGLVFTGNEVYTAGGQALLAKLVGVSTRKISGAIITNNSCYSCNGVELSYTDAAIVGDNAFYNAPSGSAAVNLLVGNTGYQIKPSTYTNSAMTEFRSDQHVSAAADLTNNHRIGNCDQTYVREIPAVTIAGAYTSIYRIDLPQYQAGLMTLSIFGNASNVGAFGSKWERLVQNQSGTIAVSNTNLPADYSYSAGATQQLVEIQFNLNGVTLTINIRAPSGAGLNTTNPGVLNGTIRLDFNGMAARITRL